MNSKEYCTLRDQIYYEFLKTRGIIIESTMWVLAYILFSFSIVFTILSFFNIIGLVFGVFYGFFGIFIWLYLMITSIKRKKFLDALREKLNIYPKK